jgi:DNA-binding transcriptional regulator YiaG
MVMLTPELIRDLQKALGLTTAQFAELLGVETITVFQWKSGRRHPKYDMQVKLNKHLREAEKKGLLQVVA